MPLVRQANGDDSVFRSFRARHQSIRELSQGVCLIGHGKVLSIQDRDKLGNSAAPDDRPDGWVRPGHLPGQKDRRSARMRPERFSALHQPLWLTEKRRMGRCFRMARAKDHRAELRVATTPTRQAMASMRASRLTTLLVGSIRHALSSALTISLKGNFCSDNIVFGTL